MYNNSGSKVMNLASTLAAILIAVSALIGIVIWVTAMNDGNGIVGFVIGLITFGINALFSWILYLLLYAFGELVYKTSQIEELLRSGLPSGEARQKAVSSYESKPVSSFGSAPTRPTSVAPRPSGAITCPFCKRVYPAGTVYCHDCNAQIGR